MLTRFRRALPMLLITLAALLLPACNINTEPTTGVSIDVQGQSLELAPGEQLLLVARATDSRGPINVTWQSSEARIAAVDATGMVAALTEGVTIITASSSKNPRIKDTVTITVTAEPDPQLHQLRVTVQGRGTVALDPEGPYAPDAHVSLIAVPDDGWHFLRWEGDLQDHTNPETLTMSADKAVTAVFSEDPAPVYTLNVAIAGDGEVTGQQSGPYDAGSSVTLAAIPLAGSNFDGWSGDATGTDNPLVLTMDHDRNIVASFSKDPTAPCTGDETVTFADPIVLGAVRTLFDIDGDPEDPLICSQVQRPIDSVTDSDNDGQELANVLNLNRCHEDTEPITSLEGLQHLIRLVRLELSCNELNDISLLAGLTDLVELNLDNNLVSDLTPLASLNKLEVLGVYNNEVESLQGLEALTNLRILYLSENRIHDLRPLTGLHNLEHLWLYLNCSITELDPVSLVLLAIGDCLSDISPVARLPSLVSLLLGLNDITDLSPLHGLNHLEMLQAAGNNINDISPLRELPQLRTALLDSNYLNDLSALVQNTSYVAGVSPFVFKRGSVELLLNGRPLPNLTLAENCLNVSDPATLNHFRALEEHLEVLGFEEDYQNQDYWCGSRFAAQGLQSGQQRQVSEDMNETLRELRQSRSR